MHPHHRFEMSSVLDSELLASHVNQQLKQNVQLLMPSYKDEIEFQTFVDEVKPMVQANQGYMMIELDRDFYMPGDTVHGSVFFELFNISLQTKLMIRIEGFEIVSKRVYNKIFEAEEDVDIGERQGSDLRANARGSSKTSADKFNNQSQLKKRLEIPELKQLGRQTPDLPAVRPRGGNQDFGRTGSLNISQSSVPKYQSAIEGNQNHEKSVKRLSQFSKNYEITSNQDGPFKMASFIEDQNRSPDDQEIMCWFKEESRMFTFRGGKIPIGQYEFPFQFQIPAKDLPSTFQFINANGENFQVKYSVTVFFEDIEPLLIFSKEINIVQGEPLLTIINPKLNIIDHDLNLQKGLLHNKQIGSDAVVEIVYPKVPRNQSKKSRKIGIVEERQPMLLGSSGSGLVQQLLINSKMCLFCSGKPINAEVRVNRQIFEPYDSIEIEIDLGQQFNTITGIKATLFVEVQIHSSQDQNGQQMAYENKWRNHKYRSIGMNYETKTIEKIQQEIKTEKLIRPFRQNEIIKFNMEKYREVIEKTKQEHFIKSQIDREILLKNEGALFRAQQKKVIINGQEAPKRPGQILVQGNQIAQTIQCFNIATCNGNFIKSSFYVEVIIETYQVFSGKKQNKLRFPIQFYSKAKSKNSDNKLSSAQASSRSTVQLQEVDTSKPELLSNIEKLRKIFPKCFQPILMPSSLISIDENEDIFDQNE
ncbi:UNKNOWN [Stylonychia lemnae]|uniref:Arrestin-like N-terminal domain-containing protein n=1 Tax=Stylonychia lemnae TaxID=5949 RepID=A0A078AWE2_STYLE|nr:UNKNOWN [Stylonychia lemnae]|eukprot:CDW85123.1 UNKNOWN [Stylonychia lemnae]